VPEELQRPPCHDHGLDHDLGHGHGLGHGEVGCPGPVEGAADPCLPGERGKVGGGGRQR
jgi:hypothetical protein